MLRDVIEKKLQQLNKTYKQTGEGFFLSQCLNPTHKDSHPSFSINYNTGTGFCFTCGYKVDKNFWLNGEITINQSELERELLYQKLKTKLQNAELTEAEYIIETEIILPPKHSDISFLCKNNKYRGISLDTYNQFDIYYCKKGKYKERIIFPITKNNEPIAFTTRALYDTKTKYIHSKGFQSKNVIYPYDILDKSATNYVIIVEGVFDVLSAYELNIPAICNWGVALNFDENKVTELIKLGIETLYIVLDKDVAGVKATEQFKNSFLSEYFDIKFGFELDELKDYYQSDCKDLNEYLQRINK